MQQTPATSPSSATAASTARFGRDLTTGSVSRHLLTVAIPMLLGNAINTGYSIINTIWIGKLLGANAVGATASSFPVVFIFIGLAGGATMATSILVSQYYGARNYAMVERTVGTSFAVSLALGCALTVAGSLLADTVLRTMNTPAEIFDMASPYLRITMLGFVPMLLSFLVTSILRGIGDTKTPLIFMAIGVAVNAVLDPLLIIGIWPFPRLGLNGAAIASVASASVALVLGLWYLNHTSNVVAFRPRKLKLDVHILGLILKLGFPTMIQQTVISTGSAFVTSLVNGFGATAIAAYGAAGRIDGISFMPAMSFSMAVSVLTGQNLGAGKPERVKRVFRAGMLLTTAVAALLMVVEVGLPHQLLSMFLSDGAVMDRAVVCLRILALSNIVFAAMFVSNGVINGAGHTMVTMVFTIVSLWVFRVPMATLLSHTGLGLSGIWVAIDMSFLLTMTISFAYYATGRWKKSTVKMANKAEDEPTLTVRGG